MLPGTLLRPQKYGDYIFKLVLFYKNEGNVVFMDKLLLVESIGQRFLTRDAHLRNSKIY